MKKFVSLAVLAGFSSADHTRGSRKRKHGIARDDVRVTAGIREGGKLPLVGNTIRGLSLERQHLCIYSEYAEGDRCGHIFDVGHAAIMHVGTNTDGTRNVDTWGNWPDSNDKIRDANLDGPGKSDVHHNFKGDKWSAEGFPYIYCEAINEDQYFLLLDSVEKEANYFVGWTMWNNCATFASDVFRDVTGTHVNAKDWWWGETPCKLGKSIKDLNGGRSIPENGVPGFE